MHKAAVELTILVATILPVAAWGQSASAASPSYHVSWERQKAVSGIGDTFALQLPFECTSDGTIFVSFVGTTPADAGIQPPLVPPLQLVSISPAAHGQVFRLDQVPELYISREIDHYASDSEVIFLVEASRENKPAKQTVPMKDGSHREFTDNAGKAALHPHFQPRRRVPANHGSRGNISYTASWHLPFGDISCLWIRRKRRLAETGDAERRRHALEVSADLEGRRPGIHGEREPTHPTLTPSPRHSSSRRDARSLLCRTTLRFHFWKSAKVDRFGRSILSCRKVTRSTP